MKIIQSSNCPLKGTFISKINHWNGITSLQLSAKDIKMEEDK